MNKYINHTDRARQIVTLLTGSITFEEAHALANHASAIEWVDEKGKPVAQAAEFHVIRPMPVGCEGKSSGVVAIATFLTLRAPTGTMYVKLGGGEAVPFTPQKE